MNQPRFDEQRGIYRDCKWCNGRGCVSCKIEADKAYKEQFPDGPKPIAVFTNDADGLAAMRTAIGPEGLAAAKADCDAAAKEKLKQPIMRAVLCADGTPEEEVLQMMSDQMLPMMLAERLRDAGNAEAAT